MPRPLKQSDPRTAHRVIYFTAVDNADGKTPIQASDMSGGTWSIYLSKAGAAPAPIAGGTPSEVSAANQKGLFALTLAIGDLDTQGGCGLTIANTGGTKTMFRRELQLDVQEAFFTTVVTPLSQTSFVCDRAEAIAGYWQDAYITMLTGVCAGQVKKIGGYTVTKQVTLVAGLQFTATLGAGDIGMIVNR